MKGKKREWVTGGGGVVEYDGEGTVDQLLGTDSKVQSVSGKVKEEAISEEEEVEGGISPPRPPPTRIYRRIRIQRDTDSEGQSSSSCSGTGSKASSEVSSTSRPIALDGVGGNRRRGTSSDDDEDLYVPLSSITNKITSEPGNGKTKSESEPQYVPINRKQPLKSSTRRNKASRPPSNSSNGSWNSNSTNSSTPTSPTSNSEGEGAENKSSAPTRSTSNLDVSKNMKNVSWKGRAHAPITRQSTLKSKGRIRGHNSSSDSDYSGGSSDSPDNFIVSDKEEEDIATATDSSTSSDQESEPQLSDGSDLKGKPGPPNQRRRLRSNTSNARNSRNTSSESEKTDDSLFEKVWIPKQKPKSKSTYRKQEARVTVQSSDQSTSSSSIIKNDMSTSSKKKKAQSQNRPPSHSHSLDNNPNGYREYKFRSRKKIGPPRMESSYSTENSEMTDISDDDKDDGSTKFTKDQKYRKPDLPTSVKSELRGFLDSTGLGNKNQNYTTKRMREQTSSSVNNDSISKKVKVQEGGSESEDSFIDNETGNYGNLESSSSSDSVVSEELDVLDLDPDHFEMLTSSDDGDKGEEEDKSQSSDSCQSCEEGRSDLKPERTDYGTGGKVIEHKCAMCDNLGDLDFNDRENKPDSSAWCRCCHCKVVSPRMLNYDRICCREISTVRELMDEELNENVPCITKHPRFEADVLEYGAFLRSLQNRGPNSDRNRRHELEKFQRAPPKQKMFMCRYSFIRWILDRLGWDNRMVVPACVVGKIRQKHVPSAGPLYFDPFTPKKTCQFSKHCLKARQQI